MVICARKSDYSDVEREGPSKGLISLRRCVLPGVRLKGVKEEFDHMSDKYTKTDLRHIAEYMIDDLRECEDGTKTTTAELVTNQGYDDMGIDDLQVLHKELFRTAKANKITLDMSEYVGEEEGLPFSHEFVVRNKRAQIKCPYCGSKDTARYIYGYPAFTEKMQKNLDNGKWALGGCCISIVKMNGKTIEVEPSRRCNECKKDFGTEPILITPKRSSLKITGILLQQLSSASGDSLKDILR